MAKKRASRKSAQDDSLSKLGIKVEGDLGELKVTETSDSEGSDEKTLDEKYKTKPMLETISTIPCSLLQSSSKKPLIGNVAVNNSENVQFGNNTYFHGPVVIKQIINKKGVDTPFVPNENDHQFGSHQNPEQIIIEKPSGKEIVLSLSVKAILSVASVVTLGLLFVIGIYIQSHIKEETPSNFDPNVSIGDSNYTKMVGVCYDNFQIILVTIIVLPITIFFIIYSLLTTQNLDGLKKTKGSNGAVEPVIPDYPQGEFNNSVEPTQFKGDPLFISPNHLKIVNRTDWLAQPVDGILNRIRQPVPWVVIAHTATEACYNQSQCILRVRLIQMFHIESKDWGDIAYNFLVAGDGSAYFGRGWDYIGTHTLGYNRYSIGIGFVGTFNNEAPPQIQLDACQKLIKLGVQLGKIAKDYKLFAHRQLSSTLSPGDKLYEIIKKWPHFVHDQSNLEDLAPKDY